MVDTAPSELPRFDSPPIDEVAVGLLFDRLDGFTDLQAGLFWRKVKAEYPRALSRPRTDEEAEVLTRSPLRRAVFPSFEVLDPSESLGNRTWLVTDDDSLLLQVQDTHFLRNWRRRSGAEYPHLDSFLEGFWSSYASFLELLVEESISAPRIRQVEVSYFNWIPDDVDKFFRPSAAVNFTHPGLGPLPEVTAWKATYLDRDSSGNPVARLWIDLQAAGRANAVTNETELGYRLTLSYHCPLEEPDRAAVDDAIAWGRAAIDRTFVDLTTPEAHRMWERTQ